MWCIVRYARLLCVVCCAPCVVCCVLCVVCCLVFVVCVVCCAFVLCFKLLAV